MSTTYSSSGGRSNTRMTYDSSSDSWVPLTNQNAETSPPAASSSSPSSNEAAAAAKAASDAASGKVSDSQKKAEKEFIEIEFNTLVGDLVLVPSTRTIKLRVGQTIIIEGIGSYLSGQYFIRNIRRTLNISSGYTHTLTVIKTGFGNTLKAYVPPPETPTESPARPEVEPVPTPPAPSFSAGMRVQITGDAIYSNAHDGVRVPDWVKAKTDLTIAQMSSDNTRALLQPINSWTYVKYLIQI